jgi:hypothetical protein
MPKRHAQLKEYSIGPSKGQTENCDSMSVVDANFKVYGIENLRIADGSALSKRQKTENEGQCMNRIYRDAPVTHVYRR